MFMTEIQAIQTERSIYKCLETKNLICKITHRKAYKDHARKSITKNKYTHIYRHTNLCMCKSTSLSVQTNSN